MVCLFYELTHWYCPGCGVTRMLIAMLRGEFYQAWRYNPLVFMMLPVLAVLVVQSIVARQRGRTPWVDRVPRWVWIVAIAVLLIYGVMRNLPWFVVLAPTEL